MIVGGEGFQERTRYDTPQQDVSFCGQVYKHWKKKHTGEPYTFLRKKADAERMLSSAKNCTVMVEELCEKATPRQTKCSIFP